MVGAPGGGTGARPRVVVVTDSTASLPAGAGERWGVEVVPLEVAIGDARYREGVDLDVTELVAALTGGTRVTTSQPSPVAFARAYARAAERGAREIVSVHLSGELSGTVRAAELAALAAPVPVHVVDSRSVAMGLGFAVLAAARMASGDDVAPDAGPTDDATGPVTAGAPGLGTEDAGERPVAGRPARRGFPGAGGRPWRRSADAASPTDAPPTAVELPDGAAVAERARQVAASTSVLFLVDSLEHLRRGGRIGPAAAAVGTLLGMRPLLTVRAGRVEVAGKVRTRRLARDRLVATVVDEVTRRPGARVAVHHLGQPDAAADLVAAIRAGLAGGTPAPHGTVPAAGEVGGACAARTAAATGSSPPGPAPTTPAPATPPPATPPPTTPAPVASVGAGEAIPAQVSAAEVVTAEVATAEVSAVIGAHAGPGLLGVVVVADG